MIVSPDGLSPDERHALAERYGDHPRHHYRLPTRPAFRRRYERRHQRGRLGEIAFVVQRPDDAVLLHTKREYPDGVWRLPTGGVDRAEDVTAALLREVYEETGFEVAPGQERLLGILSYSFVGHDGPNTTFASYVFVVRGDFGEPDPVDLTEGISGFEWVRPGGLLRTADDLRYLGGRIPDRDDWGRFRALVHDFSGYCLR